MCFLFAVTNCRQSIVKHKSGKAANGSRKRTEAPLPPIYRPAADTASNKSWDSLTKRKAPPPPRNLNVELYEKVWSHSTYCVDLNSKLYKFNSTDNQLNYRERSCI